MVTANPRIDPSTAPVAELTNYIVTTHHGYMREALPRIAGLLAACPAWDGLNPVFTAMRDELELHMRKEEAVLFPFIDRVERAIAQGVPPPAAPFGSVQNPIRMMEREHASAMEALAQMRHIADGYMLPQNAGDSHRDLFAALAALEEDLHAHIRLENEFLFPRAIAMAAV